ncbi:hypothetical protein DQ04_02731100 [Trypanosoma grayi]|uniref:hypothetical protein n=1 Tax=Trypanosoma grayi TaxID=71804 RepID=UPI0004F47C85|nr:hypothetical protein DQ04_02731100 [Trypanosoma grayi]KEG11338.1 hypothetical protein DQ04_02731100 [Trypanosoma grayi]
MRFGSGACRAAATLSSARRALRTADGAGSRPPTTAADGSTTDKPTPSATSSVSPTQEGVDKLHLRPPPPAAAATQTQRSGMNMDVAFVEDSPPPSTAAAPAPLRPRRRRPKFSFLSDPSERPSRNELTEQVVPNNTPKSLLPMWASSLTSPKLGKQRLVAENWISTDSMGTLPEASVADFMAWLRERLLDRIHAPFLRQLEENVELHLRLQYARGVIARKPFRAGDVIFALPLTDASLDEVARDDSSTVAARSPTWGLVLNSETLQRHSVAAQRRGVPSYATVEAAVCSRKSSFDPVPHPLFVDQLYCAMLLACERADRERSPLYPYLRLLSPFDDDFIRELHLGVLDPGTHLEYSDHCNRFSHYLRQIHKRWEEEYNIARHIEETCRSSTEPAAVAAEGEARDMKSTAPFCSDEVRHRQPPPSMQDLTWAFRVVLSRQRLLPLRSHVAPLEPICTEEKRMQNHDDIWTRIVKKMRLGFMDKALGVVDHKRLRVNDFDPRTIASVLPVLDMLQHPPGGVPNTNMTVQQIPCASSEAAGDSGEDTREGVPCVVIRASTEIDEGDELTLLFPRCYSPSYTLYRYGFLPLRRRADDAAALSQEAADQDGAGAMAEPPHTLSPTAQTPPLLHGSRGVGGACRSNSEGFR